MKKEAAVEAAEAASAAAATVTCREDATFIVGETGSQDAATGMYVPSILSITISNPRMWARIRIWLFNESGSGSVSLLFALSIYLYFLSILIEVYSPPPFNSSSNQEWYIFSYRKSIVHARAMKIENLEHAIEYTPAEERVEVKLETEGNCAANNHTTEDDQTLVHDPEEEPVDDSELEVDHNGLLNFDDITNEYDEDSFEAVSLGENFIFSF